MAPHYSANDVTILIDPLKKNLSLSLQGSPRLTCSMETLETMKVKREKNVDMTDAGAEYLRSRIKLTESKTDYYECKKNQKLKVSLLEKLLNRE